MKQTDKDAIKKAAKEKYNGDLDTAIAAHLMGDVVIDHYCLGQIPAGADHKTIAAIRKEITGKAAAPPRTAGASRAKKPAAKKSAAKRPSKRVRK